MIWKKINYFFLITISFQKELSLCNMQMTQLLCLKHDLENARNLKLLFYLYELISEFKTNFNKSELLAINGDQDM